jgi:hypothetical protein
LFDAQDLCSRWIGILGAGLNGQDPAEEGRHGQGGGGVGSDPPGLYWITGAAARPGALRSALQCAGP